MCVCVCVWCVCVCVCVYNTTNIKLHTNGKYVATTPKERASVLAPCYAPWWLPTSPTGS